LINPATKGKTMTTLGLGETEALLKNSAATKNNRLDKFVYGTGLLFGLASVVYQGVSTHGSSIEKTWPALAASVALVGYSVFGLIRAFSNDCIEEPNLENHVNLITESPDLTQISERINEIVGLIQNNDEVNIPMNVEVQPLLNQLAIIKSHLQSQNEILRNESEKRSDPVSLEKTSAELAEDLENKNLQMETLVLQVQLYKNCLTQLQKILESNETKVGEARSLISNFLNTDISSATSSTSNSARNSTWNTPKNSPYKKREKD
jgi:hypothetical protein